MITRPVTAKNAPIKALNTKTTACHCCKTTVIPKVVSANPAIKIKILRNIHPRWFFGIYGLRAAFPTAVHPAPFSGILANVPFNDICQFLDIVLDGFFVARFLLQIKMLFDDQGMGIAVAIT